MSALDKVLALAAQGSNGHEAAAGMDTTGEDLVAAANAAAAELFLLLADSDDDDSDGGDDHDADDESAESKGSDNAHSSHATFKKLVKNGMPEKSAAKACARSDKKVAASGLAEAVVVALGGLVSSSGDWVELTAYDPHAVALAGKGADGDGSRPYGNVPYADPGYQSDGKKRYPIDKEHIRAALSYIAKSKNAGEYTAQQLASIKARIRSAAKKFGIQVSGDGDGQTASASMTEAGVLALAKGKGDDWGGPMHHAPMTGSHSHGHHVRTVHDHQHFHNNDAEHEMHAHMGADASGQGGVATGAGGW